MFEVEAYHHPYNELIESIQEGKGYQLLDKNQLPTKDIQQTHYLQIKRLIIGVSENSKLPERSLALDKKNSYTILELLALMNCLDKDYQSYDELTKKLNVRKLTNLDRKKVFKAVKPPEKEFNEKLLDPKEPWLIKNNDYVDPTLKVNINVNDLDNIDPEVVKIMSKEVIKKHKITDEEYKIKYTKGLDDMIYHKLILGEEQSIEDPIESIGLPIIIVPQNITSALSIYNIQGFLEGEGYEDTKHILDRNQPKPTNLIIERLKLPKLDIENIDELELDPELPTKYQVMDAVYNLTKEDWEKRVVAIFSNGKAWQLKNYYWETPNLAFHNSVGSLVFNSKKENLDMELIKDWKVSVLDLKKVTNKWTFYSKSHGYEKDPNVKEWDTGAAKDPIYRKFLNNFWLSLERFIRERRPHYIVEQTYWKKN